MSPTLPFDILTLIIDIVGENKDTDLLKDLALVSHSSLQICSKHLFATIELRSGNKHVASSKKGFVELLRSKPDAVKYIRKLTYCVRLDDDDGHLHSLFFKNFLPTFSRLSSLTITSFGGHGDWNKLDSSLTSAFLYLMHLPTVNQIDLSLIQSFPLSSLTPSVNLLRLDIHPCRYNSEWNELEDSSSEIVLEMMPKIREFSSSESSPADEEVAPCQNARWTTSFQLHGS